MTTLETLKAAKTKIEGGWMQGKYHEDGAYCMAGALYATGTDSSALADSINALRDVIDDSLVRFNDAPGTTQSDVLRAFDEAIAKLEVA